MTIPNPDYKLHDSGSRSQFETGAVRDAAEGKGRYDLISPFFLQRLAWLMEKGASKYGARNWERGIPLSRYVDAIFRHLLKRILGWTDEDHEAAIAFNIMGLIHTGKMIADGKLPADLDDLPNYDELRKVNLDGLPMQTVADVLAAEAADPGAPDPPEPPATIDSKTRQDLIAAFRGWLDMIWTLPLSESSSFPSLRELRDSIVDMKARLHRMEPV